MAAGKHLATAGLSKRNDPKAYFWPEKGALSYAINSSLIIPLSRLNSPLRLTTKFGLLLTLYLIYPISCA